MIKNIIESLKIIPLFKNIEEKELIKLRNKIFITQKDYAKGATILIQGNKYDSLYIIINGECYGEMLDYSGKVIKVEDLTSPCALAPGVLFSDENSMPVSIIAKTDIKCFIIEKYDIIKLCLSSEIFLKNYLKLISDKFTFISKKMSFLAFKSIKEKFTNFLFSLPENTDGSITIPETIERLADLFCVTRPSLSRVLIQLENEKIISRNNKIVRLLDKDKLLKWIKS